MIDELTIAILQGTSRPKRLSINVSRLIEKVGKERDGVETLLADPEEFDFPADGNDEEVKDPKYTEITKQADAFFIVTPEYNHSFPGSLKRMLDSESNFEHYIHKPVAFAGVSSGPWGGVRAIESLINTVREMGMVSTFADVQFPNIEKLFDEEGKLLDVAYIRRINRAYDELIWMAKTLTWGRENVESTHHKT